MKKRLVSILLMVLIVLAMVPTNLFAAGDTILYAGKSYEISNSSLTDNVSISIDSGKRFDYVYYDVNGKTSFFSYGNDSHSIIVNKSGKTIVTMYDNMNITLPTNCTIKESDKPALFKYTLKKNTIYEFSSTSLTEESYISNNAQTTSTIKRVFDCVYYDANGRITRYFENRNGRIFIEKSGKTIVSVADYDIDLYMPYTWYTDEISIKEVGDPVLFKYTLKKNTNYEFSSTSLTEDRDISNNAQTTSTIKRVFDEVSYDVNGKETRHCEDKSSNIFVGKSGKTIVSVADYDIDLYMPYTWYKDEISIKEVGDPALFKYTLKKNTSYEFSNTSLTEFMHISYNKQTTSTIDESFDCVAYDVNGEVLKFISSIAGIPIKESGKTIVSVADYDIDIYMPYKWFYVEIFLKNLSTGEVIHKPLYPSKSILITDNKQQTQPIRLDYIYDTIDPGASIVFPTEKLDTVTDKISAVSAIQSAASDMTAEQKASATGIDLVTLYAEAAVAQAASKPVSGSNIVIDKASVQALQTSAAEVKAAAEQALISSGIITQRDLKADVKFKTSDSTSVKITIDSSAVNLSVDNVRVETPDYAVSFSAESIKANADDSPLIITIKENNPNVVSLIDANTILASADSRFAYHLVEGNGMSESYTMLAATDAKTYQISFNKSLTENIKVSLPPASGDPTYQAVTDSTGKAVGGKYNPITKTMDVKIKNSDTYTVKENKVNFVDITNKSKEMQNAINVLASKGIISVPSTNTFAPDASITRAEIAALIVRTLAKLDLNEDGGFTDVPKTAWYFGTAGSAKKHGIMVGDKKIFSPLQKIPKDQITAVTARVLRSEMKYKNPVDVNKELSVYTDVNTIAEWFKNDISLATRENLVVKRRDSKFSPSVEMTRGDAAIILYRMFMKIW